MACHCNHDDHGRDGDCDHGESDAECRERVREALADVTDPDVGASVLDSGLVGDIAVTEGRVTITADFAGFDAETADDVTEAMRRATLSVPGVERARVEGESPGHEAAEDRIELPTVDTVVAVASAKGGVGKTTVATGLARALAADGAAVGLFDADVYGPNVPDLLDAEGPVETGTEGRAEPVAVPTARADLSVMSVGLLANDEPLAWRGAMAHQAVLELLGDTAWGDLDTLVIDLPPGTGDIVLTALQSLPVDGAVLVTTPYATSVADTQRSATLFRENGVDVLGTVVNMDGATCPECGHEFDLFETEDVETLLDVPVLGSLPFDPAVRATGGAVAEPVADLAATVDDALAEADDAGIPASALDIRDVPTPAAIEQLRVEFAAVDDGESFHVVTGQDPATLLETLGAATDREIDEWAVDRLGPEDWAVTVTPA